MQNILKQISEKAIGLSDLAFSSKRIKSKWLGTSPASNSEIHKKEKELGVQLPNDYKAFLSITNGFSAPNDIEPNFESIKNIDFLKNIDKDIIAAYSIDGIEDIGENLERSILIAGIHQEQYFLLIPPNQEYKSWKYWKFANWLPGEQEFDNLESYFKNVLDFIQNK